MTEDTNQITADNLRADFLNATTNWQRWKALNRALDWALAASENAAHLRQQAEDLKGRAESKTVTVMLRADDLKPALQEAVSEQIHTGGVVRGAGAFARVGEVTQGSERPIRAGDIVTWYGDEAGWIVEVVRRDGRVVILPLGDDYELGRTVVAIQDVWPPS